MKFTIGVATILTILTTSALANSNHNNGARAQLVDQLSGYPTISGAETPQNNPSTSGDSSTSGATGMSGNEDAPAYNEPAESGTDTMSGMSSGVAPVTPSGAQTPDTNTGEANPDTATGDDDY